MKQEIIDLIKNAVLETYSVEASVELEFTEEKFGDLTSNIAMHLNGSLENPPTGGPREIAQSLVSEIQKSEMFSAVGIAGPGFINMTLKDKALCELVDEEEPKIFSDMKILVEYSDPNPFKPLHAGHLYTTLVGDSISRLVQNAGANTVRLNYGGDVGLHVAKTMWAVIKFIGSEDIDAVQNLPVETLGEWMGQRYVEGNNAYEENEQAASEIRNTNKKVYQVHIEEDHESAFAQIYWYLREQSYNFFKKLYKDLEVSEFERFIPESEVSDLGLQTVLNQLETGVFNISDGAVVFDGEKFGLHTRVFVNKDGLPTYEAKDVGLSLTKWQDYKFDQSVIITANEQAQYMQVVIKAIEQFAPDPAKRTTHLTHGIVKLSGGVKMSSRAGNILSASDVINSTTEALNSSEQSSAKEIVLSAIKYAFLKNKIGGDVVFDPKESVALEGNSGPYLQYAHARASSILRKSKVNKVKLQEVEGLQPGERTLLRKTAEYNSVLLKACEDLAPHHICTYLYELSQTFNRFYENNKVIDDEREQIRISLVNLYTEKLKSGLDLLGITAPESM